MQAAQQYPQIGQSRSRRERSAVGEGPALPRIGHPRRKSTDGPIGEFAVDVVSVGKRRPSPDTQALSVKGVERVVNLDYLRTMGIMF
jgi:hypothetical protein